MRQLSRRQKNNLIIGGLCCVLVLMGIGYAAFSSQLKINGTSSISSSWNVLITDITSGSIVGGASNASEPTHTNTTATFSTNLVSPGDSITYTITVENKGTIDATLTGIDVNTNNNPAIEFETTGIEEGDSLLQGASDELYVKVTYSDSVTSQPESTNSTITVTLDYEQATGAVVPGGDTPTIGGQPVEVVTTGDGLYKDEYEDRYFYKGTNPNNYITFNNETWRIISVESDGSLKIIHDGSIATMAFDSQGFRDSTSNGAGGTYCANGSYGCNAWAINNNFSNGVLSGTVLKDAEINIYLNKNYLNTLSHDQNKIIDHTWSIGGVTEENNDLSNQIIHENEITWMGKVGLITASEYLRANTNKEQCETISLNNENGSTCLTTNWLYGKIPSYKYLWTLSPTSKGGEFGSTGVYGIYNSSAYLGELQSPSARITNAVFPVLYLTSDITLSGTGTSDDPYVLS